MSPTESRLADAISQAFDSCWSQPAVDDGGHDVSVAIAEDGLSETDLRLIALADLILPFAAAGLVEEREAVGDLPSSAVIRRRILESGLPDRVISVGCRLAAPLTDRAHFVDEISDDWSTWLTYCMHAHSAELRGALRELPSARDAMSEYVRRPRRRVERLGADGERLISIVPRESADTLEDARIERQLDHCETIAAHADSFRHVGQPLAVLLYLMHLDANPIRVADDLPSVPFMPYLWPFGVQSLRAVATICDDIRLLARTLYVDADDERLRTATGQFAR